MGLASITRSFLFVLAGVFCTQSSNATLLSGNIYSAIGNDSKPLVGTYFFQADDSSHALFPVDSKVLPASVNPYTRYTVDVDGTGNVVSVETANSSAMFAEAAVGTAYDRNVKNFTNSMTFILDIAGLGGPAVTPMQQRKFYSDVMNPYWQSCSMGNVTFNPYKQAVNNVVSVPAVGKVTVPIKNEKGGYDSVTYTFNSKTCTMKNLLGWTYYAQQQVGKNYTWDYVGFYKYQVVILPIGTMCPWMSMGTFGCLDKNCFVWVRGEYAADQSLYMKEWGHNFALANAADYFDGEYGDDACIMGNCNNKMIQPSCGPRCFNAVYSNKLAWADPVAVVGKDGILAGTWNTYLIPPFLKTNRNHLQIQYNATTTIYVSMRAAIGADVYVGTANYYKLQVHYYNKPAVENFYSSVRIGTLSPNDMFTPPLDTWLSIRIKYENIVKDMELARVSICIPFANKELVFNDGLDDDCDTFVDMADVQDLCPNQYVRGVN